MNPESVLYTIILFGCAWIGKVWGEARGHHLGKLEGENLGIQKGKESVSLEEALQIVAAYQDRLLRARQYATEGLLLRSYAGLDKIPDNNLN